jgi:hypothetical protein
LSPGRRGRYHPRPPQTRTCAIHAFGSSRESFADDVMDAFGAILCHRHSLTEGIYAISSVWLSMSYRGQGLPGACPVPCFSTWSSPRDASLPSFGSQRAWFPALAGTMKALRLPTCASAVAYFVHFRRPCDPSVFVFAIAPEAPSRSWRGRGPLPAPGLGCRPPVVPAHSRGRQWDLSGLQVIHPVSLLRSWTPVEPMCPCLGGHIGAAPTSGTVKASDDKHFGAQLRSFDTCSPTLRVSCCHSRARLASGWLAGLYREGVEPSGSLRKVSDHMTILLSCSPDATQIAADLLQRTSRSR